MVHSIKRKQFIINYKGQNQITVIHINGHMLEKLIALQLLKPTKWPLFGYKKIVLLHVDFHVMLKYPNK